MSRIPATVRFGRWLIMSGCRCLSVSRTELRWPADPTQLHVGAGVAVAATRMDADAFTITRALASALDCFPCGMRSSGKRSPDDPDQISRG